MFVYNIANSRQVVLAAWNVVVHVVCGVASNVNDQTNLLIIFFLSIL